MVNLTLETYDFGLSRSTGKMRFRKGDDDVLVDRLVGQWWAHGADRNGHIQAECALDVRQDSRGSVAYLYHPDIADTPMPDSVRSCNLDVADDHDNCKVATQAPFPQGRNSHYRLCYAREIATASDDPCWRLRDERTDQLWFVQGYEGPMNINWFDRGTHIFVDGSCWVDENRIAHFGGSQ